MSLPQPAARLSHLPPYPFAALNQRVAELKAAGHSVVNIDIGNPDMPPPTHVIEALSQSASVPTHHGYAGYRGTTEFRAAIARYYLARFGVTISPERHVLPLLGSKEGIVNLALSYLDHGDVVLIPEIGYPAYGLGATLAGGTIQYVPTPAENGFRIDLDALARSITPQAKLLWVNYPNNPTGAVCDLAHYQQLVDFARRHGLLLASDNPYADVTFDGYRAPSVLQVEGAFETAVEFISFSKTYNMAGWRLGAAVGAPAALENLLLVKSNVDSGHFHPIYDAGIAAIDLTPRSWIDDRNAVYQRRRDLILAALPSIGLSASPSQGSLYIWAKTEIEDGFWYAENALIEANVSLAPGAIYGPGGTGYVRMSLAVPESKLDEALTRLKRWYETRN